MNDRLVDAQAHRHLASTRSRSDSFSVFPCMCGNWSSYTKTDALWAPSSQNGNSTRTLNRNRRKNRSNFPYYSSPASRGRLTGHSCYPNGVFPVRLRRYHSSGC